MAASKEQGSDTVPGSHAGLAGAREEVEAAVRDLILETTCPICLDFFTNPRSAPCQHSFCEECIWEYIKDSHSECPSCRQPGTNRRSLSRNNQLRNITKVVRRMATALGLATPEEELGGAGSQWGNGQKQAERHVGRRHLKGRKGKESTPNDGARTAGMRGGGGQAGGDGQEGADPTQNDAALAVCDRTLARTPSHDRTRQHHE